ncbi:MAG: response regulator [Candidatus Methylacidiphilales bacterium]|nr:hybrid sensor histidine kinase/response regulator [Candidatus Methylacidiphilales bacterium]
MKTILLIDDNPQLLRMLKMALIHHGYRVIEANSGTKGLEMAREHLPDLIISDIHMPDGDGSAFLQQIRRDKELRSRPVVLMTGRPDLITPRQGMDEGADDFLVKPVTVQALVNCVKARLARAAVNWRVEDEMLNKLGSLVPPQLPHEFFTPLAGIIGVVEILQASFATLSPEEVSEMHQDIHESALRLHRSLRNYLLMLDLQKDSPPRARLPLSPDDVVQCVKFAVEDAMKLHRRHDDITFRFETCSPIVTWDELRHIVEELVDNACKFSRHGTRVLIELSASGQLTVTDEGRGMSQEEIDRVGVFRQFDREKYEQTGLGLGLSLIQKLTSSVGAPLLITSQPVGTRVRIDFPLQE